MTPLAGKVALVTGASSGIGEATARLLAARGASVVLAARRQEAIAALAGEIVGAGRIASFIRTDVADGAQVEAMVAHAVGTHGRLDIAVNNAGIGETVVPIIDLADADWDEVIDTNLRGNFLCLKHQARAMLAAGNGGAIVNVGSVNSFLGCAAFAHYCASKSAQIGLTSSASAELAPHGIRVNLVCPGIIDTPLHRRARTKFGDAAYDDLIERRIHLKRAGQPIEIARAIAFLASDEASFITGTTLTSDGGFHLTL